MLLWELRHAADLKHSCLSPARGGLTVRQLRRVKEFIDAQISNEITISDLAAVAGLSQYHFIRAFKDTVGLPPYQYVLSERICRARGLLSKPDLTLDDVALAVGLSDAPRLNRVFRKFAGVTPTAFRRELHQPQSVIARERLAVPRSTQAQPGFKPSFSPSPCGDAL